MEDKHPPWGWEEGLLLREGVVHRVGVGEREVVAEPPLAQCVVVAVGNTKVPVTLPDPETPPDVVPPPPKL